MTFFSEQCANTQDSNSNVSGREGLDRLRRALRPGSASAPDYAVSSKPADENRTFSLRRGRGRDRRPDFLASGFAKYETVAFGRLCSRNAKLSSLLDACTHEMRNWHGFWTSGLIRSLTGWGLC